MIEDKGITLNSEGTAGPSTDLDAAIGRLDALFWEVFDTNHPAMLDYATLKLEFNRMRRSLEFYRLRVEEFQKIKNLLPEPYKTAVCNILANGRISA